MKKGTTLVTTEECQHGDTKTVLAKPSKYPRLKEGTEVTYIKDFTNLYGEWKRVKAPNGQIYDLKEEQLKIKEKVKYHYP